MFSGTLRDVYLNCISVVAQLQDGDVFSQTAFVLSMALIAWVVLFSDRAGPANGGRRRHELTSIDHLLNDNWAFTV